MGMLKHSGSWRQRGWWLGMAVLVAAIAWVDTAMEQAVAAAVLYTLLILLALRKLSPRGVVVITGVCVLLTLGSCLWSLHSATPVGWINTSISLLAIVVTAYLGLRMQVAQSKAQAAQERLMQLTRVSNVGALGASIAHEVNQPLASIVTSGNACQRWLAQQPPQMERAHQALQRIQQEAVRASNVISRVRAMAKGEAPQLERVPLAPLVSEMMGLMQSSFESQKIKVDYQVSADLPDVWADRLQLQQILGNLLLNAMDAVQTARERGVSLDALSCISVSAHVCSGRQVQLTVMDTGTGLVPAVTEHLFDAFWSTKPQGLGLGLSLCRTMVEAMGGQIWAENRSDGVTGAQFHVSLPLAPETSS